MKNSNSLISCSIVFRGNVHEQKVRYMFIRNSVYYILLCNNCRTRIFFKLMTKFFFAFTHEVSITTILWPNLRTAVTHTCNTIYLFYFTSHWLSKTVYHYSQSTIQHVTYKRRRRYSQLFRKRVQLTTEKTTPRLA